MSLDNIFREVARANVKKNRGKLWHWSELISLLNRVNLQFNDSRQVYVLYFKYLTQDYERFLVKNKKKTTFVVSIALTEQGF